MAYKLPRKRRDPADARTMLLDAAEKVFARLAPNAAGLKVVAQEAGVSHALITHYFGTYAGLIEATLERRVRALRAVVLAKLGDPAALAQPTTLLSILFDALADPVHLHLMRWLFLSERPAAARALALNDQGLQLISREIGRALDVPAAKHRAIEDALMTAVAAAYGYAMGRYALAAALGRPADEALDRTIRETLAHMLQAHLREVLGIQLPVDP